MLEQSIYLISDTFELVGQAALFVTVLITCSLTLVWLWNSVKVVKRG